MFNNFVKSMMAICIVTSGWSTISSGRPRGLIQSKIDDFFSNGNKAAYSGDGKNSEIKDRTADENSDINTSNSSDVSIEEKERNENSLVQYGVINIILGSSDLKASNPSGGSIEKVDVETQTIEEVKSPSTTSETMNELINTVGTLEIEGHSSGEEAGSGSDSLHYNKDADTSTFSEEAAETKIENNEKRLGQPGCANYEQGDQSGEVVAVDMSYGDQTPNDNSLYTFDEDYQVDEDLVLVGEFLANIDSSPNGARKDKIVDQLKDLMGRGMIKLDADYSYDLFDALSAHIDEWFDEVPYMSETICVLGKAANQDTEKDKGKVKEIIEGIKSHLCRAYY